jgi:large subunit ribosomal protein L15
MSEQMQLKAPKGANRKKKIIGRGNGNTKGAKCGRGDKGQNSRSGGRVRPGFEGGQMPLYRRIARRGFSNYPFKKEFQIVNLSVLNDKYKDGDTVTKDNLKEKKIIKSAKIPVKILGDGDFERKLTVQVEKVSKSAAAKIEEKGGKVAEAEPSSEKVEAKTADSEPKKEPKAKTEPKTKAKQEAKAEPEPEAEPETTEKENE